MKLGLSTSILGLHALPERLGIFAEHGVTLVEIHGYTLGEFDFSDRTLVDATKRALARHNLRLWTSHSPAYEPLDIATRDAALCARTIATMQEAMRASADLGASIFVCDAVRPQPEDPGERAARRSHYAESLRRLLHEAARCGLRLVVENHTRSAGLFVTPEDFLSLIADYELAGLGACWDTGHGWIKGQPPDVACRLGAHLATLHIHDNDGRRDRHQLPTRGGINWEAFVPCLRRIGYSGPFMMELAAPDPPTVEGIRRLVGDAVEVYRRLINTR